MTDQDFCNCLPEVRTNIIRVKLFGLIEVDPAENKPSSDLLIQKYDNFQRLARRHLNMGMSDGGKPVEGWGGADMAI